jgi:hypothetical protein
MAPVVLVWSGIARGCGGLWAFLTTRARGRARVDLERERNQGTAQAIQLLPPGSELAEGDPLGWRRVIRIPDTPRTAPLARRPAAPEPPYELRS